VSRVRSFSSSASSETVASASRILAQLQWYTTDPCGGNQWQSVAIREALRGTQGHSVALSVALSGTQWQSVALSGTQKHSVALSGTQKHSEALRGTQWYSVGHAHLHRWQPEEFSQPPRKQILVASEEPREHRGSSEAVEWCMQ
jgi:hypothetical protein